MYIYKNLYSSKVYNIVYDKGELIYWIYVSKKPSMISDNQLDIVL